MDLCFNGLGSLPMKKIDKYRTRSQDKVQSALDQRAASREGKKQS